MAPRAFRPRSNAWHAAMRPPLAAAGKCNVSSAPDSLAWHQFLYEKGGDRAVASTTAGEGWGLQALGVVATRSAWGVSCRSTPYSFGVAGPQRLSHLSAYGIQAGRSRRRKARPGVGSTTKQQSNGTRLNGDDTRHSALRALYPPLDRKQGAHRLLLRLCRSPHAFLAGLRVRGCRSSREIRGQGQDGGDGRQHLGKQTQFMKEPGGQEPLQQAGEFAAQTLVTGGPWRGCYSVSWARIPLLEGSDAAPRRRG